jgi:hypothetical protein
MTPAHVRKEVVAALLVKLSPLGFSNRGEFLHRQRVPFVTDWLAVAAVGDRGQGPINVTVNVGVHCIPLHRLLSELSSEKYDANVATFAINLGYLRPSPGYAEWLFDRRRASDEGKAALVSEVAELGLPFLEGFDGDESVRRGCKAYGMAEYNRLRLPALDFLAGNLGEARDSLVRECAALADRADAAAEYFRGSAERLLGRIADAG